MIRAWRNWKKLIAYIYECRKGGQSSFTLVTTGDEIIMYPDSLTNDKPSLRIKTKGIYVSIDEAFHNYKKK